MGTSKSSVLIVDDEPYILSTLAEILRHEFDVLTADCAEAAEKVLARQTIDLVLTDQRMPGKTGVQLLEWVREHSPQTVRLLMTGFAEFDDAVEAINRGQVYRYLFKPWRAEELLQTLRDASHGLQLERNNAELLAELKRLNQELEGRVQDRTRELEEANHLLKQRNQMLEKLALTDPLTGLPNRRAMDRLAEMELRRRSRYPSPVAMGIIDADHFKEINHRYLLPGGDQVLIGLGKTLSASLRTVDTVGRIGGEEFLVVAPETTLEGAHSLAQRIRESVEHARYCYNGQAIQVTVSVGFAVADTGVTADYEQMKHVAAAALEEAKVLGRNRSIVRSVSEAAGAANAEAPAHRE